MACLSLDTINRVSQKSIHKNAHHTLYMTTYAMYMTIPLLKLSHLPEHRKFVANSYVMYAKA